ncbi:chaperone NapD [Bacillus sp. B-jedd]|uniref:chaperone NapD n=1 Tax=Bacillus sp. B-jedd TaxID=1476857 RepID=UPI0005155B49|nr:chaperone NapD [Bacillus sp. B-jedd]CEG26958.1 NapD protein [Bacillus sp. B-jedd]
MVISGLYIDTIEGKAMSAAIAISKLKGVEVHHVEENKKIVLTLETETVDESYRISDSFKNIDGVLGTCLVFSNFEEEPFYKENDAK